MEKVNEIILHLFWIIKYFDLRSKGSQTWGIKNDNKKLMTNGSSLSHAAFIALQKVWLQQLGMKMSRKKLNALKKSAVVANCCWMG